MRSPRSRAARLVALALLAAAVLVAPAGSASAAPADWEGSAILTTATTTATTAVQASFSRTSWGSSPRLLVRTTITPPPGQPFGCAGEASPPTTVIREGAQYFTSAEYTTNCNGRYALTITASLQNRDCLSGVCSSYRTVDTHTLTGTLDVLEPGPSIAAEAKAVGGRVVEVSWTRPDITPPDFLGYRVERRLGAGSWIAVATLDEPQAPTTYQDQNPPAAGGEIAYQVLTRRAGPDGEVTSAGGAPATATVEPAAGGSSGGQADGSGGGPGSAGGSGTDGPAGGGEGSGGGAAATGGRPGTTRVVVPRLGITGRFLPPLLRPSVPTVASSASSPADDGFDESLPYDPDDPSAPAEAEAEAPDDELAAFFGGETARRDMLVPVATALVLAVWAFHLRVLARAARPH